ncbi:MULTISPECIES: flippase [Erwinia]|uniref:Oligosaccharide translocase/flippase n=1 Tax=Erwinia rhapontici TaxID=55212 RepID=A0ABM7N1W5_ERWRD|nr:MULTISPECIES: flippase [Erwinia]MBP2156320.1 PST family polysaccharide transporter [Erwinia rhapontici]MCS3606568.1 PST family polysaccharide transporter [Erwinia rhapontici]NNS05317.1 flippase [Erwinia sp. JH02]TDT02193.1 PST family polysaccharide transporter [Erwinia rhapontici]UDQ78518.1 flippase [Erwinia rhapontici]
MAKVIDKSLLINVLSLLAYRGTSFIFPLVTLPYLARILGVEHMGLLALGLACVMYCSTISDWGFNVYTTKDIAQHRDDKQRVTQLFWSTFNAKLILGCSTLAILLLLTWFNPAWHALFYIVLANSTVLFGQLLSFGWLMQGFEKLGKTSIISTVGQFCSIPLTFLLVKTPEDTWLAALIPGVVAFITAIITLSLVVQMRVIGFYRFEPREIMQRIKDSLHVFLAIFGANLFNNINVLILASMTSTYMVGLYNGADRLKKAANSVPEQIGNAFFPRVSHLFHKDRAAAIAATRKSITLSFLISLFIVVFTFFFADYVVRILLGAAFHDSANVLRVVVCGFIFGNISYPAGLQILIPYGLAKQRMHVMFIVGLINIPICCLLAWQYGAIGAASSLVLSEFLVFVGILRIMVKHDILKVYLARPAAFKQPGNEQA